MSRLLVTYERELSELQKIAKLIDLTKRLPDCKRASELLFNLTELLNPFPDFSEDVDDPNVVQDWLLPSEEEENIPNLEWVDPTIGPYCLPSE